MVEHVHCQVKAEKLKGRLDRLYQHLLHEFPGAGGIAREYTKGFMVSCWYK